MTFLGLLRYSTRTIPDQTVRQAAENIKIGRLKERQICHLFIDDTINYTENPVDFRINLKKIFKIGVGFPEWPSGESALPCR